MKLSEVYLGFDSAAAWQLCIDALSGTNLIPEEERVDLDGYLDIHCKFYFPDKVDSQSIVRRRRYVKKHFGVNKKRRRREIKSWKMISRLRTMLLRAVK